METRCLWKWREKGTLEHSVRVSGFKRAYLWEIPCRWIIALVSSSIFTSGIL